MPLIQLSNIHRSYRDGQFRLNRVLRGVTMAFEEGEFVSIQGASGSGKTTLLSIMGTLLAPDAGSYLLEGKEMLSADVDHSQIRNKQIGFVFQDHRLMPQFTVLENILLPTLADKSKTTGDETQFARQLLELTRLSAVGNQYPHTLSGGEASRVAVCRALIMKPLLLLADEPTGQLDAENARNIAEVLTLVNKAFRTTIIMVTHSEEIANAAHRLLLLKNGVLYD